ncbi:MAG: choice-of-anchor D domain-containing protein [Ignavibacteria bacterium]|nr:choice-of-anchor D domain-containing protein [Ignavibacteria bacterium]
MKTKFLSWMLLAGAFFIAAPCIAQNDITWQAFDASGADRSSGATNMLYTSTGQPSVGVSTGSGRILHSGYLFVRLVPFGAPKILAQSSVDFGSVIVSQNELRSLTVQNTGGAALNIASTVIAPAAYAIVSGGGAQIIPPGGSVTMQLRFTPGASGSIPGTLTIASNASNSPSLVVSLIGSGLSQAPEIQLSSSSLDFGAVAVSSSSTRSVTINNTGNAQLTLSSQAVGGTDAAQFVVTRLAASPIAAAGSDYVEIRFTPSSAGAKNATLTIASNDPNRPSSTVSLSGIGTSGAQPRLSVSASLLDFGTAAVSALVTRDVVLTNTGTAPLNISSQNVSGAMFSLSTLAGGVIQPGAQSTARVAFQPTAQGTYNGSFDIASNDPTSPSLSITLRGVCGVISGPRITLSRTVVDFGSVNILTLKEEDVDISNTGSSDLTIGQQSIGGADAMHFSIRQAASSPIAPGNKSTIRIGHLPVAQGSKVAKVILQSNDAGQPTVEILLISLVVRVDRLEEAPTSIMLRQNYPNPFAPSTTIEYELIEAGTVSLDVYSVTGERVATLDKQTREAGTYRVLYDATALPSGVYTAVLRVQTQSGATSSSRILMLRAK